MRFLTLRRLLFPPVCAACGVLLEAHADRSPCALCSACAVEWDRAKNTPCHCCGMPVMDCTNPPVMAPKHGVHTLLRLVEYYPDKKNAVPSRVIFKLKDRDCIELQEYLAAELVPLIRKQLLSMGQTPENTVLVWAPRSVATVRRVGHDQSKRLCYALARAMGLPRPVPMICRTGGGVQKKLGQTDRRKNAFSAFRAVPKHCREIQGRCVILVDDVVTTGATLSACAAKLRPYKPAHIMAVCVAVDVPTDR